MEYYWNCVKYGYNDQLYKKDLDEKVIPEMLEKDEHSRYRSKLLTTLDDVKEVEAVAKKSRNAYLCDALKRAGKILGPPAVAIGLAALTGEHVSGTIVLSTIYAAGAKFVDADGLSARPNPKSGIIYTANRIVPYYQNIVRTNRKLINTIESALKTRHERIAQEQHEYPDWIGMGP